MSTINTSNFLDTKQNPSFSMTLIEFILRIKQRVLTCGNENGLSTAQTLTLLYIGATGPQPMSAISSHMGCDASNTTGIIDGLAKKKLITRRESLTDRRVKVIELTENGATMRQTMIDELESHYKKMVLDKLTAEEQQQLIAILGKLNTTCTGASA